jgi:ABC-type branched-subunit amino acid transport system ATPase component
MLDITNLHAGYSKNNLVLNGINLSIKPGEVIGILGKNGCGKSTLAKAICGILPFVKKGDILFEGHSLLNMTTHEIVNCGIGYFQQGGRIFPNLDGYENLAFAAVRLKKQEAEKRIQALSQWIDLLQKRHRLKLKSSYLSGGEKHQLALAMVLLQEPGFLILDEPSAGLSPGNQKAIYGILENIRHEKKTTMMLIEQNVQLAKGFAENILVLKNGRFNN